MTYLIDFDRVVALYDVGGRDFRGVECQGDLISGNLPGIDLSNATLDGLSLDESDFTGANLSRSKITGCSLNATNFTNANLSGVEFSKKYRPDGSPFQLAISHFETLDRTNLNQETLDIFNRVEENIRFAISQGADSIERKEETYVSSLSCLQLAIFERANLSQSDLTEVNLIDANLRFANLEGANLTKADLRGADLTGANLVNANLTGANLCQANLTSAILTGTTLSKALVGWTIMPDGSISDSQAMDLIASKFKSFKRTAWKPITVKGDSDLAVSKFAGKPWINPGDSYPMCEYCQTPLRFFLQLNLSQLPESLVGVSSLFAERPVRGASRREGTENRQFGDGLLQLFYCTNSESGCDGGDVFLIKNIQPTETPLQYEMPGIIFDSMSALIEGEFPAKQIASWQAMDDYPNSYDNQSLIEFLDEFGFDEAEEFPNCPDCDRLMDRLIFEFASDDNIPYLWGDCGTGYILQCPECKDRVTFLHQE